MGSNQDNFYEKKESLNERKQFIFYRDGFPVTSSPINLSTTIGHQITRPDDATWIGRDTVAINHSKSRRLELFLVC